jgi:aspartate aminotransferase
MPVLRLSQRARRTPSSPIRKLSGFADNAELEGNKVFKLNIGQPDVVSPPEFFDGVRKYTKEVLCYEASLGNPTLRKEWGDYIQRTNSIEISPDHLMITQGASEALIFVFMTCCDPGDEIIVFDPTYANYIGFAAISGVNLIPASCEAENGYHLPTRESIEECFSNRTRAILLCNPNNPTGTVYTKPELELLLELCVEYNIFLVVDETYREMVYDSVVPLSVLHLTGDNHRVVVIDSLSKRFSLCGARIGCIVTQNEEVRAACFNIAQARLSVASIEQFAAAYMLSKMGKPQLEDTRRLYESRRNTLIEGLCNLPGVEAVVPQGAFYAVAKLPMKNTEDFCKFLLTTFRSKKRTVFVAPAAGFFLEPSRGIDRIRVAFVLKSEELREACEVLKEGLEAYLKNSGI